ncbi:MAG: type II toxin-antitoxin system HicA family toxin [Acidobacteriota bacterium]|nr:MAG: type II toxin-antitoxin system HicA family toxin [Acidobacteriota bacterium]
MVSCKKLLEKARNSATNYRYADAVKLASCYGWALDRQSGSHAIFIHKDGNRRLTFTEQRGEIPAYQLRQLLEAIEKLDSTTE